MVNISVRLVRTGFVYQIPTLTVIAQTALNGRPDFDPNLLVESY